MEASLCGRVGCGEPLVAVMLMSPQDTHAWLVGPDHEFAIEGVGLCGAHADRITVPFGWTLIDDRPAAKPRKRRKKADDAPAGAKNRSADAAGKSGATRKPKARPKQASRPGNAARTSSHPAAQPAAADELVSEPFPEDDYVPPEEEFRGDIDADTDVGDDESRRLSVVPGDPETESGVDDGTQETLWNEPDPAESEPDDSTPLLQRAFRVVKDD
ncbi:MAG: DUF3499 family protein [Acidimicrobiales bacterium]